MKIFLITLLGIGFSGCSSFGHYEPVNTPMKAAVPPAPTPPPPPPKKPEFFNTRCIISNGEGRTFHAMDVDRDAAEAKARHECEIYSRHCSLLDCSMTTDED